MNKFISISITKQEYENLGAEAQNQRILRAIDSGLKIISAGVKSWSEGEKTLFRLMAWVSGGMDEKVEKKKRRTPVSDADIRAINDMRESGVKMRDARAKYPDLTNSTFRNIWLGFTGAYVGPAKG